MSINNNNKKLNHLHLAIKYMIVSIIYVLIFVVAQVVLLGNIYRTWGTLGSKGFLFNFLAFIPLYYFTTFGILHSYVALDQYKDKKTRIKLITAVLMFNLLLGIPFVGILSTVCIPLLLCAAYLLKYDLV